MLDRKKHFPLSIVSYPCAILYQIFLAFSIVTMHIFFIISIKIGRVYADTKPPKVYDYKFSSEDTIKLI